jgi:PleD family two-component response regulator
MSTIRATAIDGRKGGVPTNGRVPRKVMIVNGGPQMADLVSTVLEAGRYELMFVETKEQAYSETRRVKPHLILLCADMDDHVSFQVLSMLKLDSTTKDIPVLLYTSDPAHPDEDDADPRRTTLSTPESEVMN